MVKFYKYLYNDEGTTTTLLLYYWTTYTPDYFRIVNACMQTVFKRQFLTLFLAQFLIGTGCSQQTRVWVLSAFSFILHLVTSLLWHFRIEAFELLDEFFLAFLLIAFENAIIVKVFVKFDLQVTCKNCLFFVSAVRLHGALVLRV